MIDHQLHQDLELRGHMTSKSHFFSRCYGYENICQNLLPFNLIQGRAGQYHIDIILHMCINHQTFGWQAKHLGGTPALRYHTGAYLCPQYVKKISITAKILMRRVSWHPKVSNLYKLGISSCLLNPVRGAHHIIQGDMHWSGGEERNSSAPTTSFKRGNLPDKQGEQTSAVWWYFLHFKVWHIY